MKIIIITTTLETKEQAKTIARSLLEKRLIACAQIEAITSLYHYRGEIEHAEEYRLTIKSRLKLQEKIISTLKSAHHYDIPQILSWQADASPDYGLWVKEETQSLS